ncbi:MAG: hypothetical protein V4507_16830 [Verrucomicrobiota bacterium]
MKHSLKISSWLLMISGTTHIIQLYFYGNQGHVIGASIFGLLYFLIGLGLQKSCKTAMWLAVTLPVIGGLAGLARFILIHPNPFTAFHVIVDLIVVPLCALKLKEIKKQKILPHYFEF